MRRSTIARAGRQGWQPAAIFGIALGTLAGCAAPQRGAPTPRPRPMDARPSAGGVWDFIGASRDQNGDQRIERAEWHLVQRGTRVSGYYVHHVTVVSGDGNPYRCNQETRYEQRTRYEVAGEVAGSELSLREVGFRVDPGPCEHGQRRLSTYRARLAPNEMSLWELPVSTDLGVVLFRRAGEPGRTELARTSGPRGGLTGTWEWEIRSVDIQGDQQIERETWQLEQRGAALTGFYDRTVRKISGDGQPFRCSQKPEFVHRTRYRVAGAVEGDRIELREIEIDAEPNECIAPRGNLDSYRGSVSGPDELTLSWGTGLQVLRRVNASTARR